MNLLRRRFLHLAAGTVALPFAPHIARAQTYPTRPVRIIAGGPPGGPLDIIARVIGQWLSERLSQPFVIENRPGGGGNIATEAVVRATPDGNTLLLVGVTHAINTTLYQKLKFNFIRDIVPVASMVSQPQVMVINRSVAAKTVHEFIAFANANPGKVSMASGGNGSPAHVGGELFKMMTGVDMVHVPYRGVAPALTDLLGGQVQVMFASMAAAVDYIRAGTVRALAITTATRSDALPELPTVGEFVPGYEVSAWQGIGAPKNTSGEVVDRLNREINAGLNDPKIKGRLRDLGLTVLAGSPADFGKLIAEEIEKWAKVIKFSGATAD